MTQTTSKRKNQWILAIRVSIIQCKLFVCQLLYYTYIPIFEVYKNFQNLRCTFLPSYDPFIWNCRSDRQFVQLRFVQYHRSSFYVNKFNQRNFNQSNTDQNFVPKNRARDERIEQYCASLVVSDSRKSPVSPSADDTINDYTAIQRLIIAWSWYAFLGSGSRHVRTAVKITWARRKRGDEHRRTKAESWMHARKRHIIAPAQSAYITATYVKHVLRSSK